MNIARFKADIDGLSQHLQEASLARLYRDYHRATATMLEASQWRVGGRWWDRLVAAPGVATADHRLDPDPASP